MDLELARQLAIAGAPGKIVLLVADGLGGLPHPRTGLSELETARTPNLDALAREGMCGLTIPVAPGVTPGSGPGHLALFGYDPVRYNIGRGVLEAVGIDFDLRPSDVAARGNFCTVDAAGAITDRRAGRVPTEVSAKLIEKLRGIALPGVEVILEPVREHRFVLVLRGEGLSEAVTETDPQQLGVPPLEVRPASDDPAAQRTAKLLNDWLARARELLRDDAPANMLLLRGFATYPNLPQLADHFRLRAAAIAAYPMYRGLAKLAGMTALSLPGKEATFDDEIAALREHYDQFDFFFIHYKKTDAAGEDGDFDGKVAALEELDAALPALTALDPDAFMVAGDHSTPAVMAAHSWHPVPFVMRARLVRHDDVAAFNERACARGLLGTFPACEALPLAMAHAGRFTKFGA